MKFCKQCNLTYGDEVNYCPKCGQLVELVAEKKICSKCGFELEDYMSYCPQCGNKVDYVGQNISDPATTVKECVRKDNSTNAVPLSNSLVSKGQIIYTLISVVIALMSFIGTGIKSHATFIEELISAVAVGVVVLYLLICWNSIKRERQKEKEKKKNKVVLVTLGGILGFIFVSIIYWTILNSFRIIPGLPNRLDFTNRLTLMIGQTFGGVSFVMLLSAVIFKIGKFLMKIIRKG